MDILKLIVSVSSSLPESCGTSSIRSNTLFSHCNSTFEFGISDLLFRAVLGTGFPDSFLVALGMLTSKFSRLENESDFEDNFYRYKVAKISS